MITSFPWYMHPGYDQHTHRRILSRFNFFCLSPTLIDMFMKLLIPTQHICFETHSAASGHDTHWWTSNHNILLQAVAVFNLRSTHTLPAYCSSVWPHGSTRNIEEVLTGCHWNYLNHHQHITSINARELIPVLPFIYLHNQTILDTLHQPSKSILPYLPPPRNRAAET